MSATIDVFHTSIVSVEDTGGALERLDGARTGVRDWRLRVTQVTPEGALAVGVRRDEPEHLEVSAGGDGGEEASDRRRAVVLERLRGHGQSGIVGEQ